MLDQSTRAAILRLKQQGHSIRGIARALQVSRGAVRDVLRSGTERIETRSWSSTNAAKATWFASTKNLSLPEHSSPIRH